MKRKILSLCLVALSISIMANDDFLVIKGEYKYSSDSQFEGIKYEGYVDQNGRPCLFGKLSYDNETTITQIKNGIPDGWMIMYIDETVVYSGIGRWNPSTKKCEPSGYGRQTVGERSYVMADESTYEDGGLAITQTGYNQDISYRYMKNGESTAPNIVYKQLWYEQNKQQIKQACIKKGIKYLEDVELQGGYVYSGGWKDACPYYYGSYYQNKYGSEVFIGELKCTKTKDGWYNFIFGNNYEAFNVSFTRPINYGGYTTNETVYYAYVSKKTEGYDTTYTYFNRKLYEKFTVNRNYEYKSYEQIDFEHERYAQILKAKSLTKEKLNWGLCVNKNSIYEGYVAFDKNSSDIVGSSLGIIISIDGEVRKWLTEEEHPMLSYPDGAQFEMFREYNKDQNTYCGIYTLPNHNYFIGFFYHDLGYANRNRRLNNLWLTYTEEYTSTHELVDITLADVNYDTEKNNKILADLREYAKRPMDGFAEHTYTNGDIYKGYWKNRKKEGQGIMTCTNGLTYNGTWEDDNIVRGKLSSQVSEYEGEFKNGLFWGNGKKVWTDGAYEEGTFEKGLLVSGKEKVVYPDGEYFEGEILNEKLKNGTYTFWDGTKVASNWTRKMMEEDKKRKLFYIIGNYVDIYYPNNSEYHGICKNGQLEGDSIHIKNDEGGIYYGGWQYGTRMGHGVDVFPNGDTLSTTWSQGVMEINAELIYKWSDGRQFVGIVGKNGTVGKGLYTNSDGIEAPKKESKTWIMQSPIIRAYYLPQSVRVKYINH